MVYIDDDASVISEEEYKYDDKNKEAKLFFRSYRSILKKQDVRMIKKRKDKVFYIVRYPDKRKSSYNKGGYILTKANKYVIMGDSPDADIKKNISNKKKCNCKIWSSIWKVELNPNNIESENITNINKIKYGKVSFYRYPSYDELLDFKLKMERKLSLQF